MTDQHDGLSSTPPASSPQARHGGWLRVAVLVAVLGAAIFGALYGSIGTTGATERTRQGPAALAKALPGGYHTIRTGGRSQAVPVDLPGVGVAAEQLRTR